MSRHCAPERVSHSRALMNLRPSRRGLRWPLRPPGTKDSIIGHRGALVILKKNLSIHDLPPKESLEPVLGTKGNF